jgi:hypothetical protein
LQRPLPPLLLRLAQRQQHDLCYVLTVAKQQQQQQQ